MTNEYTQKLIHRHDMLIDGRKLKVGSAPYYVSPVEVRKYDKLPNFEYRFGTLRPIILEVN